MLEFYQNLRPFFQDANEHLTLVSPLFFLVCRYLEIIFCQHSLNNKQKNIVKITTSQLKKHLSFLAAQTLPAIQ